MEVSSKWKKGDLAWDLEEHYWLQQQNIYTLWENHYFVI